MHFRFIAKLVKFAIFHQLRVKGSLKALIYLLDNTYIRFGTKLYRQIEPRQANLCLRAFRHDKF